MFTSRDLLARLIAFPTVSRDSNLALIDFVRDYLEGLGLSCELDYNAEHSKANLHARLGPAGGGGVMLSGHSDVVPVDGQAWSVPAFALTERDGLLYGRGDEDHQPPPVGVGGWPGDRGAADGADRDRGDDQALGEAVEAEVPLDEEQRPGDDAGVVAEEQAAEARDRGGQDDVAPRPPGGLLRSPGHSGQDRIPPR